MSATMVAANGWRKRASSLGQALAVTVMATALVTSLHLYARNPAPEPVPAAKTAERLAFETDEVALRLTGGYDGLASFALPFVEPAAWSERVRSAETVPAAPQPSRQARSEPAAPDGARRTVAALPPSRPAPVVAAAAPSSVDASGRMEAAAAPVRPRPARHRIPADAARGGRPHGLARRRDRLGRRGGRRRRAAALTRG